MSVDEDHALLAAVQAGEPRAFATYVRKHEAGVRRFLRTLLGDHQADVDDVAQEVFLQVFRAARQGETSMPTSPRAWLYTVARHAAARRFRGQRDALVPAHRRDVDDATFRHLSETPPLLALGIAAGWGTETPEDVLTTRERQQALRSALQRLPEASQQVLLVRDVLGLSGDEAAEVLGLHLAAQKSRLHRARLQLAAALREVLHAETPGAADRAGLSTALSPQPSPEST